MGARKNRNVRDNIFVLNAVTNSIINGQAQPVDIQVLDIEKCFDALWVEDCINDMFENGFDNDKLPLLYLENQNAQIAVKTPTGTSSRVTINNTIMQGTVWASLCCTTSMEKLGKHVYAHEDLVYKYKENVDIPCLGMIDDILVIQNCSNNSVKINSVVNAFVETKKLRLSKEKCHKIHIQKNNKHEENCKKLKVHNDTMKESDRVKYLGDILDKSGKVRNTINDRRNKGFGMVAEILAIISEIPLGQHRIEIGLKLRQAMLINGMLFNSEAWHDLLEKEIRLLEEVDEHLLRSLIKGHAKTPLEFLYLECGAMPIRFIISCRRMVYLHTILRRSDEELTKRVYDEQKKAPIKGDFYTLVKKDFEMVGEVIDENTILSMSKETHKKKVKTKVTLAALKYLKEKQMNHSKVKDIIYEKLEIQPYMKSTIFLNDEVSLLFAIRSRLIDCKMNFKSKYSKDDLLCSICYEEEESQIHVFKCKVLNNELKSNYLIEENVCYEDIFSDYKKQKVITSIFSKLLNIRKRKLEENSNNLSNPTGLLKNSYNVQPCIVNYSSRM